MTPSDFADALELFFGDTNPAETRVYARASGLDPRESWHLSGTLTGPYCQYAHTLPITVSLIDRGPGDAPLAQAVVPDPCCWTPELPFLYRARVELRRSGGIVASEERTLGIRPLGARGRRFYYEGKPWVLRGVYRSSADLAELSSFRAADAAAYIDDPSDKYCAAASEQGVLIVAKLSATAATRENIRRLARHAAIGLIVLDRIVPDTEPREIARNILIGHHEAKASQLQVPAGSSVVVIDADHIAQIASSSVPVVAFRPAGEPSSIAEGRRRCDALQRDLAGGPEIAGYLV